MAELAFDSRVNYQKIHTDSSVSLTVADPNSSSSTTITHSLGYIPNVRIWYTNNSGKVCTAVSTAAGSNLYPVTTDFANRGCHYKVDTTTLTITLSRGVTVGTTRTSTIYYRIYFDGA